MCSIPDSDNEECDTGRLSSEMAKQAFDGFAQGSSCPISAGNWVIAAQSLILALLIWPCVVLYKTDLTVRWKRASSLIMLLTAFILSLTAIGVWFSQCVRGFNKDACVGDDCGHDIYELKGEVSGAFGFECVIMIILLAATICTVAYQMMVGKTSNDSPLVQDGSNSDAYYRAY